MSVFQKTVDYVKDFCDSRNGICDGCPCEKVCDQLPYEPYELFSDILEKIQSHLEEIDYENKK